MWRLYLCFLFSLLFAFQVNASCLQALHRLRVRGAATMNVLSMGEERLLQKVTSIEESGAWLRKLRKNKSPAIHVKMSKRMSKLDSYLFVGDYATAHRELRTLFRDVEFSTLAIKILDEQLSQVKTLAPNDFAAARLAISESDIPAKSWLSESFDRSTSLDGVVDELVFKRSKYEVKLGSKFQEYLLAKEHLEDLLRPQACSSECQANIERLLSTLGVKYNSDRTRFSSFLALGDELSSDGIRELVDSHRLAMLTRLKHERNAELFAVFKEFATQPALVHKILEGLTAIPGMHKFRLVRLFNFFLDSVARSKHVPEINKIVRSTSDVSTKLDQVLEKNGVFGGNEFLISFSRRGDLETKRVWNQIVTAANERGESLGSEFLKADQLAKARGVLSLIAGDTPLPRWLIALGAAGGVGYFWFGKTEIDLDEDNRDEDDIIHDQIPLERDEDELIDDAVEVLQDENVQKELVPDANRSPSSLKSKSWWQKLLNIISPAF